MKKSRLDLSFREQKILDLMWDTQQAMTSVELLEQLSDIMVNATYVHRALNVLIEKELLTECGSVRSGKQYARKFFPTLTREEFAASLLAEKGIQPQSFQKVAMAFLKQSSDTEQQEVINELQQIIEQLKGKNNN